MEKIGVLVVSYGAREVAMVDALLQSKNYQVELYIADKQCNPFNAEKAAKHVVIPNLDVDEICRFAEANKDKIDFVLVGSEKPIIEGVRDQVEKRTGIPVICPKQKYAIEESKVEQRALFEEIAPEANPRFKIFNPADYKGESDVKAAVYRWLDELDNQAVVKPDKPALGKGVGVWGDHFANRRATLRAFHVQLQVWHSHHRGKNGWGRIQFHGVSATANTLYLCPTHATTNAPSTTMRVQTQAAWAHTKTQATHCPS